MLWKDWAKDPIWELLITVTILLVHLLLVPCQLRSLFKSDGLFNWPLLNWILTRWWLDNINEILQITLWNVLLTLRMHLIFNPLHVKFFRGNKNIYLRFMSFLHIDMTQVVEILPQVRQELAYSIQWILWVLVMQGARHQQPWYLLCWTKLIWSLHVKG